MAFSVNRQTASPLSFRNAGREEADEVEENLPLHGEQGKSWDRSVSPALGPPTPAIPD